MTNEHAKIREMLPSYIAGDTDDQQRVSVERHLGECSECRDYVADSRELLDGLRAAGRREMDHHVSEDLLGRHSDQADLIEPDQRDLIETHLLFCETCSWEVELLAELNASLAPSSKVTRQRHISSLSLWGQMWETLKKPALAYSLASLLLIVLGYPAGRYLFGPAGAPVTEYQGISTGTVTRLTERMRSAADVAEIQRQPGDDVLRFTLAFWPDPDCNYTATVRGDDGERGPSLFLSRQQVEKGDIYLELRSQGLKDGLHAIVLQGVSREHVEDTTETVYPFRIRTIQ